MRPPKETKRAFRKGPTPEHCKQGNWHKGGDLPEGEGVCRYLSCIRGAQLKAQNTKEINIEMP